MNEDPLIPEGYYCYSYVENEKVQCPYHVLIEDKEWQQKNYPKMPTVKRGFCKKYNHLDSDGWFDLLWDEVKSGSCSWPEYE